MSQAGKQPIFRAIDSKKRWVLPKTCLHCGHTLLKIINVNVIISRTTKNSKKFQYIEFLIQLAMHCTKLVNLYCTKISTIKILNNLSSDILVIFYSKEKQIK
jgi:hypothetical protein